MTIAHRLLAAALTGCALGGAGLVGAVAPAANAALAREFPASSKITSVPLAKKPFAVLGTITGSQRVTYGNPDGVGDLTIWRGTVTNASGTRTGSLTSIMRVVGPSPTKDAELRDTQLQVQFRNGQIFAQGITEDPKDGAPTAVRTMTVTGGTGAYASASGMMTMYPAGDEYRLAYDISVASELRASTFSFDTIAQQGFPSTSPLGVGGVSMLRAVGSDTSYMAIATRAGRVKRVVTDTVDMQVSTSTGSLFARTIARSRPSDPKAVTFAVLGGTGVYAGFRGELTLSPDGQAVTARLSSPAGGRPPLTWWEDAGRNVGEASIPGGTFLGADGHMFTTADTSARKSGDYFATLVTYEEFDGVTPVVGLIAQEFEKGTMIVTGITFANSGTPTVRPIAGGTGGYSGVTGQATSLEESSGVWKKTARLWRP